MEGTRLNTFYQIRLRKLFSDKEQQMAKATLTPGEAVKKQLDLYNLSTSEFARGIKISPSAARSLILNKIRISVLTAQRLKLLVLRGLMFCL
jgi:hypothetical protein